jgi:aminoglycoside phosphotransferase (APT) family kinase protein
MTDKLSSWLDKYIGLKGAQLGARLGGGNSNVTQLVLHDGGQAVLRRPPDNAISSSAAAGVLREYSMLKSLHGHVKVPQALGLCEDPTIIGQAFSIIEHVDGVSITDTLPPTYPADVTTLNRMGQQLVDELATLHTVSWQSLDIRQPKDPDHYVRKQIDRWRAVRATEKARELPLIEKLATWLTAHLPPPEPATLMHGDFHLDNTLFSKTEVKLAAMIDWELASVGNPHADLALMLVFWGPRSVNPPGFSFVQKLTRNSPDLLSRMDLAQRWSTQTQRNIEHVNFYLVFALWRLAAIVEGAYLLQVQGRVDSVYARNLEYDVPALLTEAADLANLN